MLVYPAIGPVPVPRPQGDSTAPSGTVPAVAGGHPAQHCPVFPFNDERVFQHELVGDMGGVQNTVGRALVSGASAGQQQVHKARLQSGATFVAQPNIQNYQGRPISSSRADLSPLQVFPIRPDLKRVIGSAAAGTGTVTLPGRQPPAGWDGEPGFAAPQTQEF